MPVSRLEIPFRRVHVRLVAGALTGGGLTSRRRHVMYRTVEDGRALLRAAQEIHAERHGAQTFTPGTHLPLEAAGERIGISPKRLRYYDAVQDLEYEGAIEWDERAQYARGDKHHVITQRGLDGAEHGQGKTVQGKFPKKATRRR
jgi:hypothetical protein